MMKGRPGDGKNGAKMMLEAQQAMAAAVEKH